ncbi:MAG: FAD-dependent oxidoreductase [Acidobacteriota bacterium]
MDHEVVVVGAGIGGLTVAALLAARGVDVCLLERASSPGGCVAAVEKFGYTFDPGVGIYPLWEHGEIHDRVFSELPVDGPEVRPNHSAYVVRMPDQTEVPIVGSRDEFEVALRAAFPECATQAIKFYLEGARFSDSLQRAFARMPDLLTAGRARQMLAIYPDFLTAARMLRTRKDSACQHLAGTSPRFRRFIDVQLQLIAQTTSVDCSYLHAVAALTIPRRQTFSLRGGAPALAASLADSIKASGARLRLDTPVLRLAYDPSGRATGVDLLSGETVKATRAIISNLTVWDTYGKLIGSNRTPPEVRKELNGLQGWGAYLLFLGMNESAADRLPSNHILTVADWQEGEGFDAESSQLMFAAAPAWDTRAPTAKRAVTVLAFTDAAEWFTYHESEAQLEQQDQSKLEAVWQRLHHALPELGGDIEVIDTATPPSAYELTRRKLGMIGNPSYPPRTPGGVAIDGSTSLPNVYMVGDTTFPGVGLASVSFGALALANRLTS